jgi:hypothetical protein
LFLTVCEIITFNVDEKLACGKIPKSRFGFLKT